MGPNSLLSTLTGALYKYYIYPHGSMVDIMSRCQEKSWNEDGLESQMMI